MSIHEEILGAAMRICRRRGGWTFSPREVALHLDGEDAAALNRVPEPRLTVTYELLSRAR